MLTLGAALRVSRGRLLGTMQAARRNLDRGWLIPLICIRKIMNL